ncbi:MAG: hypothetical protein JSS49_30090 [Planctomycetes bacterium]|nr:hypothetical protein [Planctomycetota bacterium]
MSSIPSRSGSAVISDGYTRQAFIQGIPFTTPDVHFSYRPILAAQLAMIRREMSKASGSGLAVIQAKTIEKYVSEWDIKDANGVSLPITSAAAMNIAPEIFDAVSGIMLGLRYTDISPDWPKIDDEETGSSLEEIFGKEQSDVKN